MRLHDAVLRGRTARSVLVGFVVVVVGAVGFVVVHRNQANARARIEDRFLTRGHLAARFMATYVRQITRQEQEQATKYWASRVPSDAEFQQFVDAFGFQAAVLLDRQGRLLRVVPSRPEILGRPMTQDYVHLAAALNGKTAVSDVVPSAARSIPVVAFAVPLAKGGDAAVFSGAFEVRATPLDAFLVEASPIRGAANYLVDSKGTVAATNAKDAAPGGALREEAPTLASASAGKATGFYRANGESVYFVSETVSGTRWRVMLTAPTAALYEPIDDTRWGSMALAAALALAVIATGVLFLRNSAAREALEAVTRTDVLTGLPNRRHMEEFLSIALAAARRRDHQVGVLIGDVDHFKAVNDQYGHRGGDAVLADVGARLARSVRKDEFVGRWGGEEFVAVLPVADAESAHQAAERLRSLIDEGLTETGSGPVHVTMSIGCAVGAGDLDDLVQAADEALYAAKRAGRNRVAMASDTPNVR